jgi:hypothetical protein
MAQMNTGRIIGGGLAAGLVASVIEFLVNGVWLGPRWQRQSEMLNPNLIEKAGSGPLIGWVTVDFLLGIAIVWLYAAIRPRFGPGPRTAVIAGLAVWCITRLMFAGWWFNALYTWRLIAASSAGSLIAVLAAAYVGGMLYQEE